MFSHTSRAGINQSYTYKRNDKHRNNNNNDDDDDDDNNKKNMRIGRTNKYGQFTAQQTTHRSKHILEIVDHRIHFALQALATHILSCNIA